MRVNLDKTKKLATMVADREETATIWFALRDYADSLEKTAKFDNPETEYENKAFCYTIMGAVYKLLFDIKENHTQPQRDEFIKWLDV